MSSPTPRVLQAEPRGVAAGRTKLLPWILSGIGLLLAFATLTVAFLAIRALKNAGLSFHFDPAQETLVVIGADAKEIKGPATAGHPLGDTGQKALATWLGMHPRYRAAVDADCACEQLLRMNPGQHPYAAMGDFNQDGRPDFAAALRDRRTGKFVVVIFNGPLGGSAVEPALMLPDLNLRGQGLFFDLPFEKPPHLYLGYFNSDNLSRFVPGGNTYRLEAVLPSDSPDPTPQD